MKKTHCKEMGGVCDAPLSANSFSEMGKAMHAHLKEMCDKGDAAHIALRDSMDNVTAEYRAEFLAGIEKRFNALPDA
ncbi:MAG: hypothetical protein QM529_02525 [Hydrotalea sp.]|nr:hypothetical protein [Hydrotalea sp.]